MLNFLHNFTPQPILFELGFLKIHWYGIFIVLAIIAGLSVVLKLAKPKGITSDEVYNLGFYVIIFSLLGARIYAVFLDLPFYLQNPFEIIAVWHGGLAIHGGIIGGALTLLVYCLKRKQSFWQWANIIVPGIALGQAIGRFGNYFNQELFGKPTNLPWGIPIDFVNRPIEYLSSQHFHPTFLYESILNLINFLILMKIYKRQKSVSTISWLPVTEKEGTIVLVYLINYSIIRIAMEFLRTDPAPEVLGIRWPILISLGILVVAIGLMINKKKGIKV